MIPPMIMTESRTKWIFKELHDEFLPRVYEYVLERAGDWADHERAGDWADQERAGDWAEWERARY